MPLETASSRYEANPAFPVMHLETATARLLFPHLYGHHGSDTSTTSQDLHLKSTPPTYTLQEANDYARDCWSNDFANDAWSTQPDILQLLNQFDYIPPTKLDYIPSTKASMKI